MNIRKVIEILYRVLLVLVVVIWVGLIIVEYRNYQKGNDMIALLKEKVKTYDDGTVTIDYGLGYKSITYNRESIRGREFGHLLLRERTKTPN